MKNSLWYCGVMMLACSCAVQNNFNPSKKYAAEKLREDFDVFRQVLEETHPSVYWYTSKDSMNFYFEVAEAKLKDSMSENSFRYVLSYVTSKIKCGHTSVMPSKAAANYAERARGFALPFSVKAWPDTVLVTSNLNRRDSLVKRGVILKSIEGRPVQAMVDSFFSHLSTDGYNTTHKYQQLSNGGSFRNFYAGIYGLKNKMKVEFIDTAGVLRTAQVAAFNPGADTAARRGRANQPSRKERRAMALQSERNLRIDTALSTAFMEVNSFAKGKKLRSFFRQSFKKINSSAIKNLVIDMRGNGGGNVTLSNLLTKYIADAPFKIADSLYAIKRGSRFSKYRSQY
ncbi:MAG: S41 family peptidase, partial [Bacteroidota bacterium]